MAFWVVTYILLFPIVPAHTWTFGDAVVDHQSAWKQAQIMHNEECHHGFKVWGQRRQKQQQQQLVDQQETYPTECKQIYDWSDDDFNSICITSKVKSPDTLKKNGNRIFQSKLPILTSEECQSLIDEARSVISQGLTPTDSQERENNRPTNSELGEAKLTTLVQSRHWIRQKLQSTLFPLLEDRFGLNQLTLSDGLVIGYGYFGGGSKSQPIHQDSSLLSLNIALSPRTNYTGGGTYFEALQQCLHQDQGHVMCHASSIRHAGNGISTGERWILVLFVLDESTPQLARRCHAMGLESLRNSQPLEARKWFQAAQSLVPTYSSVLKDLGRTYMIQQDPRSARFWLSQATHSNPWDVEATLGLAKLQCHDQRPRAALRRLDRLLQLIQLRVELKTNDHDNDTDRCGSTAAADWIALRSQLWDARMLAVQCALHCIRSRPSKYGFLIPNAMERLSQCLESFTNSSPPQLLLDLSEELHDWDRQLQS
jgi:hypothetical protein